MTDAFKRVGLILLLLTLGTPAYADDAMKLPDRILGRADAPVTVEEYVSLTCSHCAEFYNVTLPDLEKRYVETGKVRFILRDFPLDGTALKAAILARCMPEDEYYPFIKVLYKGQSDWILSKEPEKIITQYAKLGGLSQEKADACLANTQLQDAVIAERTNASEKLNIESTPTFIINGGVETLKGAQPAEAFSKVFDSLLAGKK